MLGLCRDLYRGFLVRHFHDQLLKRHNYLLGYTVTKLHLQREGLVRRAKRRAAHRKKRPRRPLVGLIWPCSRSPRWRMRSASPRRAAMRGAIVHHLPARRLVPPCRSGPGPCMPVRARSMVHPAFTLGFGPTGPSMGASGSPA